ncbi:MAG: heparan-alpha-glucosaminide N-acetyltransferase [Candidatus Micrarchaeota archaeon]
MGRFWEIDFFRGLSVVGMVAFNWMFALDYLGTAEFPVNEGLLWWLGRLVAIAFVSIAGVSLSISYSRNANKTGKFIRNKYLSRGLGIFALGITITITTWLYEPKATIWFGVLHLIGIATLLAIPILKRKISSRMILALSASLITIGLWLQQFTFEFAYLLWLGFWPAGWYTFDYFPILPWFGVFLLGMTVGKSVFAGRKPVGLLGPVRDAIKPIFFLGRHTLIIYLLHQPFLLLMLKIMG